LFTEGVEQVELTEPLDAVRKAGADVDLVSLQAGTVQMFNHLDKGDTTEANLDSPSPTRMRRTTTASRSRVVSPIPTSSAPDPDAVSFVRDFFEQDKPVGIICHGPWMLVETDVARGRTVTSWLSLQADLRNAGATWVDQEVVVDNGLVTSRKPDDLPAFCAKIVEEFVEGRHKQHVGVSS
jgi:protease I